MEKAEKIEKGERKKRLRGSKLTGKSIAPFVIGDRILEHAMHWNQPPSSCIDLPASEIPPELLSGLERYAAESRLLKVRLRWRPHGSTASGYLTKDRLTGVESASIQEIAVALVSYARHLYEQGGCESRFEVQVRRELEDPNQPGHLIREWRSVTFYVDPLPSQRARPMEPDFDDSDDDDDDDDDEPEVDDDALDERGDVDDGVSESEPEATWSFATRERAPAAPPRSMHTQPRPPRVPPRPKQIERSSHGRDDRQLFALYAEESRLFRMDPMVYVVAVLRQNYDRTLDTLERTLSSSSQRLDRTLDSQTSHSDFINESMRTVTQGAGEIASVGIDLFRAGLEHQSRAARLQHETENDKDRGEIMRDAVQQGSLLAQAVIMSNTAKRRAAATEPQPNAAADARAGTETRHAPRASAAASRVNAPSSDGDGLDDRIRSVLSAISADEMAQLSTHAPTIAGVIQRLRSDRSLRVDDMRELVLEAIDKAPKLELLRLKSRLTPEFAEQVEGLLERLLAEAQS